MSTDHSFTAQYNVHMLVYYEIHSTYIEAARRKARFKNWCRKWKLILGLENTVVSNVINWWALENADERASIKS